MPGGSRGASSSSSRRAGDPTAPRRSPGARQLLALLEPCVELDENPARALALQLRERAAVLGRTLVDQIESGGLGFDRLGQCVRNLFECLELGREGAAISLRAGEDPRSLQRPV